MSKLTITLKIAGGNYPFTIEAAEEELYRKAERLVAERMSDFNQIIHKLVNTASTVKQAEFRMKMQMRKSHLIPPLSFYS